MTPIATSCLQRRDNRKKEKPFHKNKKTGDFSPVFLCHSGFSTTLISSAYRRHLERLPPSSRAPTAVISSEVERSHEISPCVRAAHLVEMTTGFCRHLDQTNGVSAWRDPLTRSRTTKAVEISPCVRAAHLVEMTTTTTSSRAKSRDLVRLSMHSVILIFLLFVQSFSRFDLGCC